jgi:maleate isomerase
MTAAGRVRLGMLTPSSNTALEPVTARMLAGLPEVTAHFSRFRVTEIALGAAFDAQFDVVPMLAAAELLADARCDSICWNGTSASWLGIERDRALCAAITGRTGIPATSAVLAMLDAFRLAGVRRYGLVTPYTQDVQQAIVRNLEREGFQCAAERHAGLRTNFDFAAVASSDIAARAREVAVERPEAVVVLCTNMDGASLAPGFERDTGITLLDSIALSSWGALRAAGADPTPVTGWGRLFAQPA